MHEIQFIVVDSSSSYNAIFGRPIQSIFKVVPSVPHLAMKFLVTVGTRVVCGNQEAAEKELASRSANPPPQNEVHVPFCFSSHPTAENPSIGEVG
ncbi:hypothetical protein KSP40_PGU019888 [Platanthera guangdongensis]|uniref:Uncharacterized protein n=1 Tax=Platanthera guangdongensis TaxID=2320717 RepID=A0ABR2LUJ7_9ASPA